MAKTEIKLTQTKFLLTELTTDRQDDEGNTVQRKLPANTTQRLTDKEVELLDKLTNSTGREHYREPRNERVIESDEGDDGEDTVFSPTGAKTEDGKTAAQVGLTNDIPTDETIGELSVKDLKAYLDAEPASEYGASASKADLQELAKTKAATARAGDTGL